MTTTAISNPANAVTPNVIPAAVPAPIVSLELSEDDFCLSWLVDLRCSSAGSMPIMMGPCRLVSAANSATELRKKIKKEKRYTVLSFPRVDPVYKCISIRS